MVDPGWMREESPFHKGELAIHARLGTQERIDRQGRRFIREYLTQQHQEFFTQLAYLIVGTVDETGNPWASMLVGKPGFISILSDRSIEVEAEILSGDPLAMNLAEGIDIGLLGIELSNRRRNRLNGVVSLKNGNRFEVRVKQSFGNCPQYIQQRTYGVKEFNSEQHKSVKEIAIFSDLERAIVASSDTFFIATAYQNYKAGIARGVDVSHRGGKPGFVKINDDTTLTIPDFSGNGIFNTFGNLELNPKAGLLFINFDRGDLLYITGIAEVIWSGAEISQYPGAERLLRFHLERGYLVENSLPLYWSNPKFSPSLIREITTD